MLVTLSKDEPLPKNRLKAKQVEETLLALIITSYCVDRPEWDMTGAHRWSGSWLRPAAWNINEILSDRYCSTLTMTTEDNTWALRAVRFISKARIMAGQTPGEWRTPNKGIDQATAAALVKIYEARYCGTECAIEHALLWVEHAKEVNQEWLGTLGGAMNTGTLGGAMNTGTLGGAMNTGQTQVLERQQLHCKLEDLERRLRKVQTTTEA